MWDDADDGFPLYSGAAWVGVVVIWIVRVRARPCERVPLQWATTQNNLGNALWRLGESESGTARLDEAVAAYRELLRGQFIGRNATQRNLEHALKLLEERKRARKPTGAGNFIANPLI